MISENQLNWNLYHLWKWTRKTEKYCSRNRVNSIYLNFRQTTLLILFLFIRRNVQKNKIRSDQKFDDFFLETKMNKTNSTWLTTITGNDHFLTVLFYHHLIHSSLLSKMQRMNSIGWSVWTDQTALNTIQRCDDTKKCRSFSHAKRENLVQVSREISSLGLLMRNDMPALGPLWFALRFEFWTFLPSSTCVSLRNKTNEFRNSTYHCWMLYVGDDLKVLSLIRRDESNPSEIWSSQPNRIRLRW